mgnify:CR=1 FL=1
MTKDKPQKQESNKGFITNLNKSNFVNREELNSIESIILKHRAAGGCFEHFELTIEDSIKNKSNDSSKDGILAKAYIKDAKEKSND